MIKGFEDSFEVLFRGIRAHVPPGDQSGSSDWLWFGAPVDWCVEYMESAHVVDVELEVAFWLARYQDLNRDGDGQLPFEDYVPALRLGISAFLKFGDISISSLSDISLAEAYERGRGISPLEWSQSREATHAAFLKLQLCTSIIALMNACNEPKRASSSVTSRTGSDITMKSTQPVDG